VHNVTNNNGSSNNLPSYPPDGYQYLDAVYWRNQTDYEGSTVGQVAIKCLPLERMQTIKGSWPRSNSLAQFL